MSNPLFDKDKEWISDIAAIYSPDLKVIKLVEEYCRKNKNANKDDIYETIDLLKGLLNNHIGLIELNSNLDIETVTEIFIRINSAGAVLSQADFAMSKIAANEVYGGNTLRKCIDYFCHLAIAPDFYEQLVKVDKDFTQTEYFPKMTWLRRENDDLYDPSYTDMLRVAFTSEFKRGRLEDLVALLSGRNFETRQYEEEIAETSFARLKKGIFNFMNETHFKRFVMILRSAGFVESSMIRSQNAINVAYIVYLYLKLQNVDPAQIESYVRKWFVLSVLTRRYSGSPESQIDFDIKRIDELGFEEYARSVENAVLSNSFWKFGLPQQFNTSLASSPYFNVYLAAQVKMNDKGFLSRDITVQDLITHRGDVHHIFPREYLKRNGLSRGRYNQIANYVMMQSEINISVGNKPPADYFQEIWDQCNGGGLKYGGIDNRKDLIENLKMNCIPEGMENKTIEHYDEFLQERRKLMANKIKAYYKKL